MFDLIDRVCNQLLDYRVMMHAFIQVEICHILFVLSVEFTELGEIASTSPSGYVELPTCPICLGWYCIEYQISVCNWLTNELH